jgi:hypothetical protein
VQSLPPRFLELRILKDFGVKCPELRIPKDFKAFRMRSCEMCGEFAIAVISREGFGRERMRAFSGGYARSRTMRYDSIVLNTF